MEYPDDIIISIGSNNPEIKTQLNFDNNLVRSSLEILLTNYLEDFTRTVCKSVCKQWHSIIRPYEKGLCILLCTTKFIATIPSLSNPVMVFGGNLVKFLYEEINIKNNLIYNMCIYGNFDMAKWLKEKGCLIRNMSMKYAIRSGNIEMTKWLETQKCKINDDYMFDAADSGNSDMIKWLHEKRGLLMGNQSYRRIIEYGDLDLIKWSHKNIHPRHMSPSDNQTIIAAALTSGKTQNIEWLLENGYSYSLSDDANIYNTFAIISTGVGKSGSLDVIKWTYRNSIRWDISYAMNNLIVICGIDVLQYLLNHGYIFTAYDMLAAMKAKKFDTVIWLMKRCSISFTIPELAAKFGRLDIMIMVYDVCRSYRFTDGTFSMAAQYGDLSIMKWLHEKECPMTGHIIRELFTHGHKIELKDIRIAIDISHTNPRSHILNLSLMESLRWLLDKGCKISQGSFVYYFLSYLYEKDRLTQATDRIRLEKQLYAIMELLLHEDYEFSSDDMDNAIYHGHLGVIKWLKDHKVPFSVHAFYYASRNGSLENMKWLKDNDCTFASDLLYSAAHTGNLENLIWLKQYSVWNNHIINELGKDGELHIIKWLIDNGCPYDERLREYAHMSDLPELKDWITKNTKKITTESVHYNY